MTNTEPVSADDTEPAEPQDYSPPHPLPDAARHGISLSTRNPRARGKNPLPGQEAPDDLLDVEGAGSTLWVAIAGEWLLEPHERVILHQACRVADLIAEMQDRVDLDGVMPGGQQHPLLARLEGSRALLGRLVASLRIPVEDDAPQRRGPFRGAYGPRRVS